ncbi:MAG: hypothetical protein HQK66_08390 [Desulfamplus sp.]|nr:hypothetical protein [Desulfamplus sp.]
MNNFYIFVVRLMLGMGLGILLARIFRPEWSIFHGLIMGAALVAGAYAVQAIKQKNRSDS